MQKEFVVWGAGVHGIRYFLGLEEKVSFFIDNDNAKCGSLLGLKVVHPTQVHDWKRLFIAVPANFYSEIARFLSDHGLIEGKDYIKYDGEQLTSSKAMAEKVQQNLEMSLQEVQKAKDTWKRKCIYVGNMEYINQLIKSGLDIKVITSDWWEDHANKLVLPFVSHEGNIPIGYCPILGESNEKEFCLNDVLLQLQDKHPDWGIDECEYYLYAIESYIKAILNHLNPSMVIALGSIGPFWVALHHMCTARNIPIIFSHWGILPGTVPFDTTGEMGESLPAVYGERFRRLPVEDDEVLHTKNVWKYLYHSKANRKLQPRNNAVSFIQSRVNKQRPIIFFAGVYDAHSHMVPYTEKTRKYHSPIFKSSIEAAFYLAEVCRRNNWNFIYKPHPMDIRRNFDVKFPQNTIFIDYADINELIDFADVTITILSTASYNALIRYKPVVMLGYTQLRGKGCTYEAFEKDKIETAIKSALENGFTQEQQDAFLLHMAQCLKYYLYDDLQDRPIRYGRPVPKSIDEFYELDHLLKEG